MGAKKDAQRSSRQFNQLSATFQKQLEKEKAMLEKMSQSRSKYEMVLIKENKVIKKNLGKGETKHKKHLDRQRQILLNKKKMQETLRSRGRKKREAAEERLARL